MSDTLSVNRCSCGWQFYALNEWVKKCPQCRDEINTCINCGADGDLIFWSLIICNCFLSCKQKNDQGGKK